MEAQTRSIDSILNFCSSGQIAGASLTAAQALARSREKVKVVGRNIAYPPWMPSMSVLRLFLQYGNM
jgi:hypothetical protein